MRRTLARLGHPTLRCLAEPVAVERLGEAEVKELIADLKETLVWTEARCLTAPQIGVELQVLVYRPMVAADGAETELRIVANPMMEPEHGDLVYDWEECLSVPGLKGLVPRYPRVRLRGVDEHGRAVDYLAEAGEARVIQHAHDHLSGVVFLDRMRDLRSLAFVEEWKTYLAGPKLSDESKAGR